MGLRQFRKCILPGNRTYFTADHLRQLIDETGVTPEVNQIELHPFLQQRGLVEYCRECDIAVEGWAPLIKGQRLDDDVLTSIAAETQRSVPQVLIRWSLQKGFVVIAKSSNAKRIRENATVFDFALTTAQMERIDALEANYRTAPGWDPSSMP